MTKLPPLLEIKPLVRPPCCSIRVPGSKSITNRALVLGALAQKLAAPVERTVLTGALRSEDTLVMLEGLRQLGLAIDADWEANVLTLRQWTPVRSPEPLELYTANSGTTMRFLTALVALEHGTFQLSGVARMHERPIHDLLEALQQLGVTARSVQENGCPPVRIEAHGLPGGEVRIRGDISSQFLSGLLMAAPLAQRDVSITVEGTLVSVPYVTMTTAMMNDFGAAVENRGNRHFHVPGRQRYRPRVYGIEPDASAASYFAGAAAILGGDVVLQGLPENSQQGDIRFFDVLERMGCRVLADPGSFRVQGGPLRGIDVDMNDISDCVMTLGAVACFAEGPTTIRNVAHIRHKETDRLAALATELRRIGAAIEERDDGLRITPRPLRGAPIATYNDHRMAMSLALVGLRVPGIVILNPGCVGKTYPDFFKDLERLRTASPDR